MIMAVVVMVVMIMVMLVTMMMVMMIVMMIPQWQFIGKGQSGQSSGPGSNADQFHRVG